MQSVHENENYKVFIDFNYPREIVGDFVHKGAYIVVNRHTSITEYASTALPEVLHAAEQLNAAMLNKAWEWQKKKDEPTELNPELFVN